MSSDLANNGWFETKTTNSDGEKTAESNNFVFDRERLRSLIDLYFDPEEPGVPNRIEFLLDTADELPEYTADICRALATCDDPELQILAPHYMLEVLKQGVHTGRLPNDDMDAIRDTLGTMLTHDDEELQDEAVSAFRAEEKTLIERDKVTFQRIGWMVSPNVVLMRPVGLSEEIQRRGAAKYKA